MPDLPAALRVQRESVAVSDQLVLPATPASARVGRSFLTTFCLDNNVPESVRDDVVLIVSELVSNALTHARSGATVTVLLGINTLRLQVADGSPDRGEVRSATPDRTNGRGLLILEALATRWGTTAAPPGKLVWVELDF